jgi:hypothetical protein
MFDEKTKSQCGHTKEEEKTRCLSRGISAGGLNNVFDCMRTCNALVVGVCRASNLHLIIHHYLQFSLTHLSLLPHFPCKHTQIITLDVFKHD